MFGQKRLGRMLDPIGDTERAELGEIAVVKDQNKMGWFVAETLKHVSMAAWKGPDIAWFEVIRLGLTSRINDCCVNTAFENERPFRCSHLPVKFGSHRLKVASKHRRFVLRWEAVQRSLPCRSCFRLLSPWISPIRI